MKIESKRIVFDRYTVSTTGEVRSLLTCGGNVRKVPLRLNPRTSKNGYLYCDLVNGDEKERWLLHRLVCFAFGRNIQNKVVHHRDGNKLNNSLRNLLVTSASENVKYSTSTRKNLRKYRVRKFAARKEKK